MPTYFKPLRRKIGVATLVMACVFAAGWVRSTFYYDDLFCDTDPRHRVCLISHRNNLCWMRLRQFEDTPWLVPGRILLRNFGKADQQSLTIDHSTREWKFAGICFREGDYPNATTSIFMISYWYFITPLTLLSAWLLRSNPRAKKTEPSVATPATPP